MDYSLSDDGKCSICLSSVVDDNSRGKAQLICGHLFHLDCIGTEFNYRGTMKCPNCRVTENGEWRMISDEDEEFDEDDQFEHHHPMGNVNVQRVEFHIYPHNSMDNNTPSTQRESNESQQHSSSGANIAFNVHSEGRSSRNNTNEQQESDQFPAIFRTFHYHHHTIVMSPPILASNSIIRPSGSNGPTGANASLRTFGSSRDASNPSQAPTRVEQAPLQDRTTTSPSDSTSWINVIPPCSRPSSSMEENVPPIGGEHTTAATGSEPSSPPHHQEVGENKNDGNDDDDDDDRNLSLELSLSIGPSSDVQPCQDSDDSKWYDAEEETDQTKNAATSEEM